VVDDLRGLIFHISKNYNIAKNEPFTNHPLANLIRHVPEKIIKPLLIDDDLSVRSSAGQAVWATVPWIAIINESETDGAQEGVYVVYLFSEDMKRVYLALSQGVTRPIEKYGRRLAFQKMNAKKIDIRTNYPLSGFVSDDKVKLADSGLGADYARVTIFYKKYDTNNLPENYVMIEDLKKLVSFYSNYLVESNVLTEGTDFSAYIGKVEEGKKILRQHYVRERNTKIIKEAKRLALQEKHELRCDVCGFSFFENYGEHGKDFIEGHHKNPVSDMGSGKKTSIADIALLCPNCHRMVHRKMPWLSIEELKQIHKNVTEPSETL